VATGEIWRVVTELTYRMFLIVLTVLEMTPSVVVLVVVSVLCSKILKCLACSCQLGDISVRILQSAVDALVSWSSTWQLEIAVDKSYLLSVGKTDRMLSFVINGSPLPTVTVCRDLDITVRNDLDFSDHISDIVVRAHKTS